MTTSAVLTLRERQTLVAYSTGMTYSQIGKLLYISTDTVKTNMGRIRTKLGVHRSLVAVEKARKLGLLDGLTVPERPPVKERKPSTVKVSPEVAVKYPSTTWGVTDWYEAMAEDEDLFNRILRGIGKALMRREATTR